MAVSTWRSTGAPAIVTEPGHVLPRAAVHAVRRGVGRVHARRHRALAQVAVGHLEVRVRRPGLVGGQRLAVTEPPAELARHDVQVDLLAEQGDRAVERLDLGVEVRVEVDQRAAVGWLDLRSRRRQERDLERMAATMPGVRSRRRSQSAESQKSNGSRPTLIAVVTQMASRSESRIGSALPSPHRIGDRRRTGDADLDRTAMPPLTSSTASPSTVQSPASLKARPDTTSADHEQSRRNARITTGIRSKRDQPGCRRCTELEDHDVGFSVHTSSDQHRPQSTVVPPAMTTASVDGDGMLRRRRRPSRSTNVQRHRVEADRPRHRPPRSGPDSLATSLAICGRQSIAVRPCRRSQERHSGQRPSS